MSGEPARAFVDSNVLVYAYDRTAAAKAAQAGALVEELWRTGAGALSIQVLQEFFVTVTKRLRERLPVSDARRTVASLGRWRTHEPKVADLLEAVDIQRDFQISFWDAMIIRSAACLGCDVLFTEDLNHGQVYRGVRVENPFV